MAPVIEAKGLTKHYGDVSVDRARDEQQRRGPEREDSLDAIGVAVLGEQPGIVAQVLQQSRRQRSVRRGRLSEGGADEGCAAGIQDRRERDAFARDPGGGETLPEGTRRRT